MLSHIISQPWLIFWPVLCRSPITLHNHTYTRCSLLICPIFCACIIQNYILLDQSHKMTSYLAIVLDISYSNIEHFLYVPGPGICGVKGWPGVTWVRGFLQNCLDSIWRWGGAKTTDGTGGTWQPPGEMGEGVSVWPGVVGLSYNAGDSSFIL